MYAVYGGESKLKEDIQMLKSQSLGRRELDDYVSPTASMYIDKIGNLLNNETTNIDDLHLELAQLETEAENALVRDSDKSIALSAMSVAKSSSSYWDVNVAKWGTMCGYKNYELEGAVRSSIWKSDVGGAICFGLHMWFNGTAATIISTGPSGWAAMGMILAGAAIESSAVALLCEFEYVDQGVVMDDIFESTEARADEGNTETFFP